VSKSRPSLNSAIYYHIPSNEHN